MLKPGNEVAQVFSVAKNKLRIKKPIRLFTSGGTEVLPGFPYHTLSNDSVLLVSSGEDFVGSVKQVESVTSPPATVHLMAQTAYVDSDALLQLNKTATLPGVSLAVGFPDLCPGLRFPVGAAFAVKDRIYPELIGGDIGCGMALWKVPPVNNVDRVSQRLKGLDQPWKGDVAALLTSYGLDPSLHTSALGTIGGGNHFAELQTVHEVVDSVAFSSLGLHENDTVLLVHSGSRSLGKAVLDNLLASTTSERVQNGVSLDEGTINFSEYIKSHDDACNWARCNRDLIGWRFCAMLYGRDETVIDTAWMESVATKIIDIHHNNVEKKVMEEGNKDSCVWLHRKGAAPSDRGVVPIPGSRGAHTYLVLPQGSQVQNAFSLPHGAGRRWARSQANSRISEKYKSNMDALYKTSLGSTVICEDRQLLVEEALKRTKKSKTLWKMSRELLELLQL
ncbi:release factor H-coupled R [Rhizoclosmatium globosum]|uniref:3'-phosphate/5'-hydroxy nucleic acid ligase n=1 Tax=Rhizoclosmatium globosum TaxID=329046 RepID=A0A1Y2BPS2_9FUNG|nr:release factor H-coupled R [Rhizoclosmatium globosum]|eukprot:ORY36732.1 release factor H-coupled R [Rhizoclosmatium globosum]